MAQSAAGLLLLVAATAQAHVIARCGARSHQQLAQPARLRNLVNCAGGEDERAKELARLTEALAELKDDQQDAATAQLKDDQQDAAADPRSWGQDGIVDPRLTESLSRDAQALQAQAAEKLEQFRNVTFKTPKDLEALGRIGEWQDARRLADADKRAAEASTQEREERSEAVPSIKSVAESVNGGLGGLFKALTGLDIRNDDLKKGG